MTWKKWWAITALVLIGVATSACEVADPAASDRLPTTMNPASYVKTSLATATAARPALDVYLPAGAVPTGGWPAIVYIHGGGWYGGSRSDIGMSVPPYVQLIGGSILKQVDRGFVVVSIDYTLSSATPNQGAFPAALLDAKRAIQWVQAQTPANPSREIPAMQVNANKVAVAGSSAGGNLAVLVAVTPGRYEPFATKTTTVRGAIDLDGPNDLHSLYAPSDPGFNTVAFTTTAGTPLNNEFGATITYGEMVPAYLGCQWQQFTSQACINHITQPLMGAAPLIDQASPKYWVNRSTTAPPPIYLICGHTDGMPADMGCNDAWAMHNLIRSKYGDNAVAIDDTAHPAPGGNHFNLDVFLNFTVLSQGLDQLKN